MRGGFMADLQGNRIRIQRARGELDALRNEVFEWLKERRKRDLYQQYLTQLNILETALLEPLKGIGDQINAISESQPAGTVYATCKTQDKRLTVVRRVWSFFSTKFDQRDDENMGKVLAAADEVVWSCYAQVFRNAPKATRGSVPLPYIEPRYDAPKALVRDQPPQELKLDQTDLLIYEYWKRLPIPIISLPLMCLKEPWWLIYLGHEVGHHLQYDLVSNWGLVSEFRTALEETAKKALGSTEEAELWGIWSREIFADICSVTAMGPWAARAMAELELADESAMLSRGRGANGSAYPSAVARLELMRCVLKTLGLEREREIALGEFHPEAMLKGAPIMKGDRNLRELAARDLGLIPKIVSAAMAESLGGLGTFKQFFGWDTVAANVPPESQRYFEAGGIVDNWADGLIGRGPLIPNKSLSAARLLTCSGLKAWLQLAAENENAVSRTKASSALKENLLTMVEQSREEGRRAAEPYGVAEVSRLGEELTRLMIQTIHDSSEA
jgi:hypothetical protein